MSVESGVNLGDVLLVPVVPPALVVPQRELRGHRRRARERGVLPDHGGWGRARRDEQIQRPALRHPVRISAPPLVSRAHVYVRLRGVVEVDAGGDGVHVFPEHPTATHLGVREHDRYGPVETER